MTLFDPDPPSATVGHDPDLCPGDIADMEESPGDLLRCRGCHRVWVRRTRPTAEPRRRGAFER